MVKSRIELIRKICKDKFVLDIGCTGMDGRLYKQIVEVSSEAIGIDIDSEKVSEFKESGYEVYCQDAESFSLDKNFDVIVAGELMDYLGNPAEFLNRARDHLKDDGKLVLTVPNIQSAYHIKRTISGDQYKGKLMAFTKPHLRNLLEKKGFEVIKIKNINHDRLSTRGKLTNFFLPQTFRPRIFAVAVTKEKETKVNPYL